MSSTWNACSGTARKDERHRLCIAGSMCCRICRSSSPGGGGDSHGVYWEFAAKGGHNGEHHNHNDCGTYVVHLGGANADNFRHREANCLACDPFYNWLEKIILDDALGTGLYTAEPGSRIPANLYRPVSATRRVPAIVMTCGHGDSKSLVHMQYVARIYFPARNWRCSRPMKSAVRSSSSPAG